MIAKNQGIKWLVNEASDEQVAVAIKAATNSLIVNLLDPYVDFKVALATLNAIIVYNTSMSTLEYLLEYIKFLKDDPKCLVGVDAPYTELLRYSLSLNLSSARYE